jgi:hypothetical protein
LRPLTFEDLTLYCVGCGEPFTFTAGQRIDYADKGWSEPRRCPACRELKHRQGHKQGQLWEQTDLKAVDDVLNKARQTIEKYRGKQ